MQCRGFAWLGRCHRAHASRLSERWREILGGRVESTGGPETALRPPRDKIIKATQVDLTSDVKAEELDVLRAYAIAVAHHAVRRWLSEDILKPVDSDVDDVGLVDKGVVVFDEPLQDPTMPRRRHAAILFSIYGTLYRLGAR